jgi:hypothetical protein
MGPERELRLLASVAAGDAWLFCPRAGPSLSSCARSWTPRASLTSTVASSESGSGSGAAATVSAFLLNRLAVAHPNRATEIIPLFSGNCAR